MAEQGPLSGQTVGNKYILGELLGEGGFGAVYKAQHLYLQRQQAVKILLERHFQKQAFHERFLREAQTVAALDHPNIIHMDDFWVDSSRAYLVMPFITGGTFQHVLLKQRNPLELEQIVFYLEPICAALDYAHAHRVAHLDLKPLNLLVHDDGRLLLADFGLAHLMKQGVVDGGSSLLFGTPHYMAPEHIQGHPEKRSDLFSLGVIVYRMLVGQLPFEGQTPEAVMVKNLMERPPAPRMLRKELPQEIEEVVEKALAKQPEQRYQTANDFLSAFKKALTTPAQTQTQIDQLPTVLYCPVCMSMTPSGTTTCPNCKTSFVEVIPAPAATAVPTQIPPTEMAPPVGRSGFIRNMAEKLGVNANPIAWWEQGQKLPQGRIPIQNLYSLLKKTPEKLALKEITPPKKIPEKPALKEKEGEFSQNEMEQHGVDPSSPRYQDRTLVCRDCGRDFTFVAEGQNFFARKVLMNPPARCPDCCAARRRPKGT